MSESVFALRVPAPCEDSSFTGSVLSWGEQEWGLGEALRTCVMLSRVFSLGLYVSRTRSLPPGAGPRLPLLWFPRCHSLTGWELSGRLINTGQPAESPLPPPLPHPLLLLSPSPGFPASLWLDLLTCPLQVLSLLRPSLGSGSEMGHRDSLRGPIHWPKCQSTSKVDEALARKLPTTASND